MEIDLTSCHYGDTTNPGFFLARPTNYYFFLAGLVMQEKLAYVLEIGTNYGGSIMSISRGLGRAGITGYRLVTVDITLKNDKGFKGYPHIKRIKGDSTDEKIIKEITGSFDREIGLLYIDSLHEYEHTRKNIDIYSNKLNPRYIVLDDIRQCDEMKRLWSELKEEFKDEAFDASDISIRKGAGFGVIRCLQTCPNY